MHILHITGTYPPSVNGVAIVVANLKKELERKGNEVMVLAPDHPMATKERGVLRYPSLENPIIKDYPVPLFPGLRTIIKLLNNIKPDIVHAHHPFHIGYFARLISEHYNIPLVFTYHTNYDVYAQRYLEFLPKDVKLQFLENQVNDFCEKCDLIISPAEYIKADLKKNHFDKKTITIPSPVADLIPEKIPQLKLKKMLKLPVSKKILLCVSRLAPEKDLDLLIKSMKYIDKEFVLVFVGAGNQEKELKDLTRKLFLKARIIFVGNVPHNKINRYYQAADYFYYSSISETQGLIFLESAICGLPIIAVDSEAAREWVRDEFGVITKRTAKELAKGIVKIQEKEHSLASQKATEFAANFTPEKLVGQLEEAYKSAIAKKARK
jgi:1,2-diacylglycerol 3-alpha-glucosyltransferase